MSGLTVDGTVAVVTGASSGIGWYTAGALAGRGATVVAAARREQRLRRLVDAIQQHGGKATAIACDVTSSDSVAALRDRVFEEHGRCDILVNNAGIPGGGPFAKLSLEQIERIVAVNYLGVLYCTHAFLPGMLERRTGHVVNVASLAGRFALPGSSVYSSTKHAVVSFSEALHFEVLGHGVRVTAVNPGLVATEKFPHRDALDKGRRVMHPNEIAALIVKVVEKGIAPEISKPRSLAALQAVRVLAPPAYRFGLEQVTKRTTLRSTRAGED
jgi:uncharacterized protein